MIRLRTSWLALVLTVAACSPAGDGNFSQFPGFAEYYAANPPSETLPDEAGRELLARFRPRFFLAPGEAAPLDFYADYVAQGVLYSADGRVLAKAPGAETLNRHKDDPAVVLVHAPAAATERPAVYGRIDRERHALPELAALPPLTFLTYNLVFAASGLPAGLPAWQARLVDLVASTTDWHQLDHYVAVTLALADERPIAVTFQQHHGRRTYVLGDGLELPADGRLPVAIARRSNELYPRPEGVTRYRTAPYANAAGMRWLVLGESPPWLRADDIVEPGLEIETELRFLAPADAFYTFKGWLGERRLLPGRDGPPGADYSSLPGIKPKVLAMLAGFWRESSGADMERVATAGAWGQETAAFALSQAAQFLVAVAAASR